MRCSNRKTNICQLMTITLFMFFLLIPLSVKADQQYCVQYNIPNVTSPLTPNQTVTVQATLTNCGSLTWTKDKFTLSYHWYSGSNIALWDGVRSLLPQDVNPGNTVSLTAQVTAPGTEGTYTLKWDMVQEPGTWFSSMGNAIKDQTNIEVKQETANKPIEVSKKPKSEQAVSIFSPSIISALTTTLYTPNITSVYPAPPIIPDRDYLILGSGFRDKPGQVKMTLPSGQNINLNLVVQWSFGLIRVHVPAITGQKDGRASIQVETPDHSLSNILTVDFKAAREKFLQDEKAKLDAHNAKVNAEFERLCQKSSESSSRLLSIQNEANQLNTRFKTASPSEKAQIEKRARELLQQIEKLGYCAGSGCLRIGH
jgi:hypothetical protein